MLFGGLGKSTLKVVDSVARKVRKNVDGLWLAAKKRMCRC